MEHGAEKINDGERERDSRLAVSFYATDIIFMRIRTTWNFGKINLFQPIEYINDITYGEIRLMVFGVRNGGGSVED
jgi:hypothetical protein